MARKNKIHNILLDTYWAYAEEARAADQLTVIGPTFLQVDWSMGCEKPYPVEFQAAALKTPTFACAQTGQVGVTPTKFSLSIGSWIKDGMRRAAHTIADEGVGTLHRMTALTPCRKCTPCLVNRRRLWRRRIIERIAMHPRSWFVTLTLHAHARHLCGHRPEWVAREVTLYLNALRQRLYRKHKRRILFKYVVAFERHKDGTPHVHLIIHEGFEPISRREIEAPWKWGFANAKLVDDTRRAVYYVSKYLLKNFAFSRIRASLKY